MLTIVFARIGGSTIKETSPESVSVGSTASTPSSGLSGSSVVQLISAVLTISAPAVAVTTVPETVMVIVSLCAKSKSGLLTVLPASENPETGAPLLSTTESRVIPPISTGSVSLKSTL